MRAVGVRTACEEESRMERGREILRQVREWITPYWEELQGAPQLLWKWTEGQTAFRAAAV